MRTAGAPAHILSFTHDMSLALSAADLVISRAGASTLAELAALGKPSILFPYPYHRDRHQHANAQVLVDQGAALMLEDRLIPEANEHPLQAALEKATHPRHTPAHGPRPRGALVAARPPPMSRPG